MTRGRFITFEGGEGAGKSTQAAILARRLRLFGIDVLHTREPGGTPRAEAIREVLLSGKAKKFGPLAEAVLFYAARKSHLELAIRPALARGAWVICDRFSNSTRAYQGAAGGLPRYVIETIDRAVVGLTEPDLTVIFDLPPELGLKRAAERKAKDTPGEAAENVPDRFETMNMAFHRNLREEFLSIAKAEPRRCVVIDASQTPVDVEDKIWAIIRKRFGL